MAHNSNSHDAPWLLIPKHKCCQFMLETREVHVVVGAMANCSTHAGLPH